MREALPVAMLIMLIQVLPAARAAEPDAARQSEILYRLQHDCGSCHGMTLKGGLGPPLLPAALAGKSEQALADVIVNGVPTTPMPPWGFEISPTEAMWLARRLKRGVGNDD